MAQRSAPILDRSSLSDKTPDHVHEPRTRFRILDFVSLGMDILFCLLGVVLIGGLCSLSAFGIFPPGRFVPPVLEGPLQWEMCVWLIFTGTSFAGLWGLLQFWLRRIWVQTYGSRARVWTGGLAWLLFLGAVMPLVCLVFLNSADLLITRWGLFFAVAASLYLIHALQVVRWS